MDLVVHSSLPEVQRGLIPSVIDGTATAAPPAVEVAPEAPTDAAPPAEAGAATPTHDDHDDEGH